MPTKIQWATNSDGTPGETWNPVAGCRKVSPGCLNCYAIRQAHRLAGNPNEKISGRYAGLTQITNGNPNWTGAVSFDQDVLLQPLHRRKPTTYFISLSDLFYPERPDEDIDRVFAVMALCPRHTFQILTKYPERMYEYIASKHGHFTCEYEHALARSVSRILPLPNVWLGVSAEDQKHADERIPLLLRTPAAVRFASAEPLLWPVGLYRYIPWTDISTPEFNTGLDWVIVGGESGPAARPCNVEWVRSVVRQCKDAGVPVFVKQLGAKPIIDLDENFLAWPEHVTASIRANGGYGLTFKDRKGGNMDEWAEDLRVRQYPEVAR